jgi:hypothetical protein
MATFGYTPAMEYTCIPKLIKFHGENEVSKHAMFFWVSSIFREPEFEDVAIVPQRVTLRRALGGRAANWLLPKSQFCESLKP